MQKKQKKKLIRQHLWNYLIRLNKKLLMNCLRTYTIRKQNIPMLNLQIKDAQSIETETQATNSKFSKLQQEFDKVNNAATEKKITD